MGAAFTITPTVPAVKVVAGQAARLAFKVTNNSGQPITCRAKVIAEEQAQPSWFGFVDEPERTLAPQAGDEIPVSITVPADTTPGQFQFHLLVYSIEQPAEVFTEGPMVALEVSAPEQAATKSPFPWKIVAAIVGVLLVGGIFAWAIWSGGGIEAPALEGKSLAEAEQILQQHNLSFATQSDFDDQASPGTVLKQAPAPGTTVDPSADTIQLTIAEAYVCLYQHYDFRGWRRCFEAGRQEPNFGNLGINDQVSAVRIFGPVRAELFEHFNYQGRRTVYERDIARIFAPLNDTFSSLNVRGTAR